MPLIFAEYINFDTNNDILPLIKLIWNDYCNTIMQLNIQEMEQFKLILMIIIMIVIVVCQTICNKDERQE